MSEVPLYHTTWTRRNHLRKRLLLQNAPRHLQWLQFRPLLARILGFTVLGSNKHAKVAEIGDLFGRLDLAKRPSEGFSVQILVCCTPEERNGSNVKPDSRKLLAHVHRPKRGVSRDSLFAESQGKKLALTVVYVPYPLSSGEARSLSENLWARASSEVNNEVTGEPRS